MTLPPCKEIYYVAHALGADPIQRPLNIARVQRWFKFLIDFGPIEWGFSIPWLPYAQNLDETTYRDRGIRDGIAMARRLDGIILVGGEATRQSKGAAAEAEDYKMRSKPIYDLTAWGDDPPLWLNFGGKLNFGALSHLEEMIDMISDMPDPLLFDPRTAEEREEHRHLARAWISVYLRRAIR